MPTVAAPIAVQLLPLPRGQRLATGTAIFLRGGDVGNWLKQIAELGLPLGDVNLLPIPVSASDRCPVGVLIMADAVAAGSAVRTSAVGTSMVGIGGIGPHSGPYAGEFYRRVGTKLFIPCSAQIVPEVLDQEWNGLLSDDYAAYVWHPASGLIAFETGDVLRVVDLLEFPAKSISLGDFNAAVPGTRLNERLLSLQVWRYPSLDDVMESGRDDIGSRSEEVRTALQRTTLRDVIGAVVRGLLLPFQLLANAFAWIVSRIGQAFGTPGKNESSQAGERLKDGFNLLLRGLGAILIGLLLLFMLPVILVIWLITRLLRWLGAKFPAFDVPAGRVNLPPWLAGIFSKLSAPLGGLVQWTTAPLLYVDRAVARGWDFTQSILNARQHAIDNLMKMLQENPDEGLKYALPFGGTGGMPRGIAPPSTSLFKRNVDFQLGNFGGGGPVDPWMVAPQQQASLLKRYRELAQRELDLGRYRRAAYIYGELLGDLPSAAGALRAGRFYREAAVLYRDKLHNKRAAAECLEQGGLIEEAISLYRELNELEKVGDLHAKLGQKDEAASAYREAVDDHLQHNRRLKAAGVLENKLHAEDEALDVLEQGWPDSPEAQGCITQFFASLGKRQRHDRTREKIAALAQHPRLHRYSAVARILSEQARGYPDDAVRHQAADATRVVSSRALLANVDTSSILSTLARLDESDRLLERDCQRFGRKLSEARLTAPQAKKSRWPAVPASRPVINSIRSVRLPTTCAWVSAVATWHGLYIAGTDDRCLTIGRCAWSEVQEANTLLLPAIVNLPDVDRSAIINVDVAQLTDLDQVYVSGTIHANAPPKTGFNRTDAWPGDAKLGLLVGGFENHSSAFCVDHEQRFWSYSADNNLIVCRDTDGIIRLREQAFDPVRFHDDIRSENQSRDLPPRMCQGGCGVYVMHHRLVCEIDFSQHPPGRRTHSFFQPVTWISATERQRRTRVAVSFEKGVDVYWDHLGTKAQRVADDLSDPKTVFLLTGKLIAVAIGKGYVYDVSQGTARELCSFPLSDKFPVTVLAMQARGFVVLYESGEVEVFELNVQS